MQLRSAQPIGAWRHGRRGRSINARALQLAAIALSFILIALLVVTSSRAAFVAQNDNVSNQVSAAAVDLTDNDSGGAMFNNVTGLLPLVDTDRCIDVTYTGNIDPPPVKLFVSAAPTGGLVNYLNLRVDVTTDTADAFGSCTSFESGTVTTLYNGTLAGFATAYPNYGTSLTAWDPAGTGETRTFRFRLTVQDNALAEGQSATFGFTWETRTS
jgi:hypothetical protein